MSVSKAAFLQEANSLLRLGTPIYLGQLAQAGIGTVDAIMAGNFSAIDLAAISIAQSLWLPILIFFIGVFNAATITVSHHHGAQDTASIKSSTHQSLWIALMLAPLGLIVTLNAEVICGWLGVEAAVTMITVDYLFYMSFSWPAITCYFALRGYCDGQGATRAVMLINIAAFVCNIPLNYIFVYGKLGAPVLGGAGCGLASCIVIWIQLGLTVLIINKHSTLKLLHLFRGYFKPNWREIFNLLVLGVPIGFTILAEAALFSAVALVVAPLGANVLAANQVALSVAALAYMLPLSIGLAINIRTGHHLGAKNILMARFSSLVGITIAVGFAVASMTLIVLARHWIASLYTDNADVVLAASGLLFYAAIYQIPDAIQVCVNNALRSFKDTRVPMIYVLFTYWVVSLPLGWSLTTGAGGLQAMGATGMWIGLVCGLSVAAVLLSVRFRWLLNDFYPRP